MDNVRGGSDHCGQLNDYRLNSLTALTMKLTKIVAFKAGFSVRFDNVPVTGKKKTDTQTVVGLVFDII